MQKRLFLLVVTVFLFLGCEKKETITEKLITPERQADTANPLIKSSSGNIIELDKKSLGKAYILIPSFVSASRQPTINFSKPLIISFEKSGSQVALFNLTQEQLYTTIPSSRLLQTFSIVSENDNVVKVDLGSGFKSMAITDNLGLILKDQTKKLFQKIESGEEDSIEIKDSFVRKIESANNSVYFEQVMRLKVTSLEAAPESNDSQSKTALISKEVLGAVVFEIKPYIQNLKFQPQVYDKLQRVGYFLNFSVHQQEDEPTPYIAKWDISEERGSIQVLLSSNTPEAVIPSITEGVQYWNKVFGKEIFKVKTGFNPSDKIQDRSLVVFWIPWESAGFARAGFQVDPLTGEIFRGQVFLTSSWYNMTKNEFSQPVVGDNSTFLKNEVSKSICQLNQKDLMNFEYQKLSPSQLEKITTDTVRQVVAHEVGHALGLRHNFAGSFTHKGKDLDIINQAPGYLAGQNQKLTTVTTTVMDYLPNLTTAMSGSIIQNTVLPYDQQAISWGYLNGSMTSENYNYCSDEHIMAAASSKKSIYGCDRFDQFNNVLLGNVYEFIFSQKNKVQKRFSDVMNLLASGKSYYSKPKSLNDILVYASFDSSTDSFDSYLYKDLSGLLSIKTVIDNYLDFSFTGTSFYESTSDKKIVQDSKELGGLVGIIEKILKLSDQENGHFYENQVISFFKQIQPKDYSSLSDSDLETMRKDFLTKAKAADSQFLGQILAAFPLQKITYSSKGSPEERGINANFEFGNPERFIELSTTAFKQLFFNETKEVTVGKTKVVLLISPLFSTNLNVVLKNFIKTNYPKSIQASQGQLIDKTLVDVKKMIVSNTFQILTLQNLKTPEDLSFDSLTKSLDQINWSEVSGVMRYQLENDLSYLKSLEIKPN